MRAHIRIFLAFRICLNFYPILKIEPARPNLPPKTWGQVQGKKLSIFAIFCGSQPDTFCILSICDQKESSEPILPLWGHERPLTRLSKDTLTFDLGPTVWAHKAGAFSARKLYGGRKYIFSFKTKNLILLNRIFKITQKLRKKLSFLDIIVTSKLVKNLV